MSKLTVFIILSLFAMSLALYGPDSKVVKLTSANFREKVVNSKELWFVEFYAPWCGHCKSLAPEWDKLAKSLEGIIRVGAVDMDSDRDAGASYGIQGFPTIKFFGADKNKPTDYNGGRTANDLLEFGLNQAKSVAQARLKGKAAGGSSNQGGSHGGHQGGNGGSGGSANGDDVVVLTEGNFDELLGNSEELWIVEFYAPWCGHCKRLEPEWNAAATKLKGEVKIAKVDATVEGKLGQRFGVSGYPTIKMFPSGPKADHLAENYEGGRDADSIASYALEKKAQFKPAARVVQLTGQSAFDEQCGKNRGICVITFVPHLLDSSASERQELLDTLAEVAKSQRKNPVTYLWAQGGDYYDIEEKFTLGSGYPAVVAVSVSKSKYTILRASFNKKNLESFIGGLLNGKESLFNLPAISFKNVKEWDGKDADKPKDDDL